MQKYSILVFHRDMDDFLTNLQTLGMVDITRKKRELDEGEKEKLSLLARYITAIRKLKDLKAENPEVAASPLSGEELLQEYEYLEQSKEQTNLTLKAIGAELQELTAWGNIDPTDIERLKQLGFTPRFFVCPRKRFSEEWQKQQAVQVLNEDSRNTYFVALQVGDAPLAFDAQEMKAPTASLEVKADEHFALQQQSIAVEEKLNAFVGFIPQLEQAKARLMDSIDYTSVKQSAEGQAEDKLMVFTGWIPKDQSQALESFLDKQEVVYLEQSIESTDSVPIKLKNNWFAKLFEPITEMYSLPNYTELDLTPFLAPFYMLFFGFCFGDAGYGILLITIGFIIKPKLPKPYRPFVSLIQWLGLAAVLFGALTGSVFGIQLSKVDALGDLKHKFLTDTTYLMLLSIALGALQVLVGMVLQAVKIARRHGVRYAISKIAWIVFLLSGAPVIGLPKLDVAIPQPILYVLYGLIGLSALCIFFYNSPGKNPLLNMGVGVWDSFNMATGLLGDLLSYIRLFALGLTGGMLGGAFNNMSVMLSPDVPVLGFIVSCLILVLGHGVNIMLGMLGALIHPIRLTFVEFFKNAGYEGGGVAYKPFKYNQPNVK